MSDRGTYRKLSAARGSWSPIGGAPYGMPGSWSPVGDAPYGSQGCRPQIGVDLYVKQGPSIGTWLLGGLLVGGAVLWAKHQSNQIAKLSSTAGVPYESFIRSLGTKTKELSGVARAKFQGLTQRTHESAGTAKEP